MKGPYTRPMTMKELAAMPDEDIDFSEIPEMTDEWFKNAVVVWPQGKRQMSMRFDGEVLTYFRSLGPGFQSKMNAVLRAYVEAQKAKVSGNDP